MTHVKNTTLLKLEVKNKKALKEETIKEIEVYLFQNENNPLIEPRNNND